MDITTNASQALASLVLHTVQLAWVSGDQKIAAALGIEVEDVETLLTLSPSDLAQLSRYGDQFLRIHIDPQKLRSLTRLSKSKTREEQLIIGLLQAGATYSFLHTHFGLEHQEISSRKNRLRLAKFPNKRSATDKEHREILQAYRNITAQAENRLDRLSPPELIYEIHRQTGLIIPVISAVVDDDGYLRD